MKDSHNPRYGPLAIEHGEEDPPFFNGTEIWMECHPRDGFPAPICNMRKGMTNDDARRLVACLLFCEGTPTHMLFAALEDGKHLEDVREDERALQARLRAKPVTGQEVSTFVSMDLDYETFAGFCGDHSEVVIQHKWDAFTHAWPSVRYVLAEMIDHMQAEQSDETTEDLRRQRAELLAAYSLLLGPHGLYIQDRDELDAQSSWSFPCETLKEIYDRVQPVLDAAEGETA